MEDTSNVILKMKTDCNSNAAGNQINLIFIILTIIMYSKKEETYPLDDDASSDT